MGPASGLLGVRFCSGEKAGFICEDDEGLGIFISTGILVGCEEALGGDFPW